MAYLFENKELVYEKQMRSLKQRIILVNSIIFVTNLIVTLILILNRINITDFFQLVVPVFILNLVISYAMIINRDSHEQLYLAMYTSIIGIIVVIINIFLIVKSPATYILIYLAIPIISIYKDKKAVSLGFFIILLFSTIIHFNYTNYIVGLNNTTGKFTPYLYEGLLLITLIVQSIRIFFNESEINNLYDELDLMKEVELKYHQQIFSLLTENRQLSDYANEYINEETQQRLQRYIDLFNRHFYIKEDLNEKIDLYLNYLRERDLQKIIGKRILNHQLKEEFEQFDAMLLDKPSKLQSMILKIKNRIQQNPAIEPIKNFEFLFMDPDMNIEMQIVGFILLYDNLRKNQLLSKELTHDEIIHYFSQRHINEFFDKEIVDFFLEKANVFNDIFLGIEEKAQEGNQDN